MIDGYSMTLCSPSCGNRNYYLFGIPIQTATLQFNSDDCHQLQSLYIWFDRPESSHTVYDFLYTELTSAFGVFDSREQSASSNGELSIVSLQENCYLFLYNPETARIKTNSIFLFTPDPKIHICLFWNKNIH